jgi:Domain of unknown function (DUF4394)
VDASRRIRAVAVGAMLVVAAPVGLAMAGDGRGGDSWGHGSRGDHRGLDVRGVTDDGRLIKFASSKPGSARTAGKITGLVTDTKLVGIDYRPATGADGDQGDLYGLGNAGGVYVVNAHNAKASLVSRLDVALAGTSFGVDFNPTVDRLRVISDTGQSLRVNVDTGATLVDTALTYPGPPVTSGTGVTGAAYTNNDADPNTATTLYDIDSTLDQVAIQSPANAGLLAATGKLGVDTDAAIGSDIYSTVRNGTTVDVEGYASLTVGGQSGFYSVQLFTGRATAQGSFH